VPRCVGAGFGVPAGARQSERHIEGQLPGTRLAYWSRPVSACRHTTGYYRFRLVAVTQFRWLSPFDEPRPVVHRAGSQTTARQRRPVARQGRESRNSGRAARAIGELVLSPPMHRFQLCKVSSQNGDSFEGGQKARPTAAHHSFQSNRGGACPVEEP